MRVKATGGGAYKFAEVRGRRHCRPHMITRGFALPACPSPPQQPSLHCCLISVPTPCTFGLQLFKERLGLIIEGEDEMACMVEGCNFLLNAGAGCAAGWAS